EPRIGRIDDVAPPSVVVQHVATDLVSHCKVESGYWKFGLVKSVVKQAVIGGAAAVAGSQKADSDSDPDPNMAIEPALHCGHVSRYGFHHWSRTPSDTEGARPVCNDAQHVGDPTRHDRRYDNQQQRNVANRIQ